MANPINSFLQGFAAVDQLETNRQNRRFRDTQQSRLRTLWGRQDKLYERQQLEQFRGDRLNELDATMRGLMAELPEGSPLFNDPVALLNEAHKRMVASNPEFGEHVALAMGLDPATGSLVRDPTKPVSGIGFVPPDKDPAGEGGMFFEIDSVNGKQPHTDNRTSSPNDPVTLARGGIEEMIKVYGPGIMKNDLLVAQQLRNLVGVEPTGNPLSSQDQREAPVSTPSTPTQPSVSRRRDTGDAEINPSTGRTRAEEDALRDEAVAPAQKENQTIVREEMDADLRAKAFGADDQPASTRIASGVRLLASQTLGKFADTAKGAFRFATGGTESTRETVDQAAGFIADTVFEVATGEAPETQGQGIDAKGTIEFLDGLIDSDYKGLEAAAKPSETVATTPKDISDSTGKSASAYNRNNFTQPNDAAARTVLNTPTPGTPNAVQGAADSVLGVKTKRPNLVQMYNAVGLTKLGILTPAQLTNYAQTGQFNAAARGKLQTIQSGDMARIFDPNSGALSAPFSVSGAAGGGSIKDRAAVRKEIEAQVEGEFLLPDGSANKRALQQFTNATEEIFSIMGIEQGDVRRTNDVFLNNLARGSRFVQRFDEDDIQFFDLPPPFDKDFEVPYTAGNVAIGSILSSNEIVSQEDAAYALRSYLETLKPGGRLTSEQLLVAVQSYEPEVLRRWVAGGRKESREDIRDKLIQEQLTESEE